MAEIRLLDAVTVGQIAAGEVIERPASVVKELLENAVDAGATRITVNVERGGADLIEVTDDGAGIPPDQLPLAVRRHATSKLAETSDLDAIATLGFRGEGLASIAAVSHLEILSRTPDASIAMRIEAHGEQSTAPEPVAAPVGTSVRARLLFADLPVRREYLRSPSTEFTRISSFLSTFALAYPRIAFALRHDGKDVWVMPQTAQPVERLAMVFGRDNARALIPLAQADRSIGGALSGFVSAPGHDRPDRRMQVLFINGRLLRSTLMSGAWSGGYSTFAMIGRQPYGVLFLELSPESVDANVHPTKSDVRLRYGTQVADGVRRTIAVTLRAHATQRSPQCRRAPTRRSPRSSRSFRRMRRGRRHAGCACSANCSGRTSWRATAIRSCSSISTPRTNGSPTKGSLRARKRAPPASRCSCRTSSNSMRRRAKHCSRRSSRSVRAASKSSRSEIAVIAWRARLRSSRLHRRSRRGAEAARRARARLGLARVPFGHGCRRIARGRGDDEPRRSAAGVREPDALSARASNDGETRADGDRAHVQALIG